MKIYSEALANCKKTTDGLSGAYMSAEYKYI